MANYCTVTVRVEEKLREEFAQKAAQVDRSVSQLIREFMRNFETNPNKSLPKITEEERAQRQEAVNYGYASVNLEGFHIDDAERAHAQRYIDGEIDLDEFVRGNE